MQASVPDRYRKEIYLLGSLAPVTVNLLYFNEKSSINYGASITSTFYQHKASTKYNNALSKRVMRFH